MGARSAYSEIDRPAHSERTLIADRYHTGVRLASMLLWLVAIALTFVILRLITNAIFGPLAGLAFVLLIVAAVVAAQPLAWWGEKQLLQRWPSGRLARLVPGALEWHEKAHVERFDLKTPLNYWRWRFVIANRRAGRVPNGHHCLALRLVQDDAVVTLYTFMPPAAAEPLIARYRFYQLGRIQTPDNQAAGGRDPIFMAAERERADDGAELDPADFEALLDHLAANLPDFSDSQVTATLA
jgi:hypothetical protein